MSFESDFDQLKLAQNASGSGDATNKPSTKEDTGEFGRRAREHGWVPPVKYDYDAYNATRESREKSEDAMDMIGVPTWAANAARYEWLDEYGDVGPSLPALEKELYRDEHAMKTGQLLDSLTTIPVTIESEAKIQRIENFKHAGLHPVMLENVGLCGYKLPTPIQAYCIPSILTNHDVIAVAQTGSGKTAAFFIPILSKLMGKAKKLAAPRPNPNVAIESRFGGVIAEPLVLVIVPTRELSVQIFDEARRLCYRSMLRPCVAYGGGPAREQADELRKGCDILIGTPGRLMDFMRRGGLISFHRIKYTVIDEADEMVSPDWADDLDTLLSGGDNNEDADHRYMMFSATFPKEARQLAKKYLADDHIRIRVGRAGSSHKNITQRIVYTDEQSKRQALLDMLMATPPARTIVFVNSKKSADFIDDFLFNNGLPSTSIHSDRTQREREDALRAFKNGKTPILVATGVSARGLDINDVMHVIQFDLPNMDHGGITEYVHRIGRTARIGNKGLASAFYNERNEDLGPMLVRTLMETGQEVPDFLEIFKPGEGEQLDFEDETDEEKEEDETNDGDDDGWGAGPPATDDDAWGTTPVAPAAKDDDEWAPKAEPERDPTPPPARKAPAVKPAQKPVQKAVRPRSPSPAPPAADPWGEPDDSTW